MRIFHSIGCSSKEDVVLVLYSCTLTTKSIEILAEGVALKDNLLVLHLRVTLVLFLLNI